MLVELEHGAAEVGPVVRALDEAGLAVESLDLVEPTLDDVFVAKTGEHLEGERGTGEPEVAGAGRTRRVSWRAERARRRARSGAARSARPSAARSSRRR